MRQIGTPHVVVVGGGLAGLSAAVACADGGARVTLFEGRPRFGGATWSFERRGLAFDNGQHVYLRCCTAYRRFLERLGTAELAPLQARLAIPVLSPSGNPGAEPEVAWIRRSSLPSPLHLTASLLAYRHLSLADRAATVAPPWRCAACASATPRSTPRPSAPSWPATASPPTPSSCCGTSSPCRR